MDFKNLEDILVRRQEIEEELLELLRATKSDFGLEDIKEIIYNEEDQDDLTEVVAMFDDGNIENLSNVLETVNDAWNYFPHKILGGVSPAEMILEHQQKH